MMTATELERLLNVIIPRDAYHIGYFLRVAGAARPAGGEYAEGWDAAEADKDEWERKPV